MVPVRNLHEISDSVSFEQAALVEPLAVALAIAAMAKPRIASTVAILGAGPIGLNCLAAFKASGATRILCLDLRARRLDLARSWGATATFSNADELARAAAQLHPEGTDIVIDATGNEEVIRFGIALTRFGGTLVLAGYCEGKTMELKPDAVHLRDVRVLGAGNVWGFTGDAARCVADGLICTEQMITHRYRWRIIGLHSPAKRWPHPTMSRVFSLRNKKILQSLSYRQPYKSRRADPSKDPYQLSIQPVCGIDHKLAGNSSRLAVQQNGGTIRADGETFHRLIGESARSSPSAGTTPPLPSLTTW